MTVLILNFADTGNEPELLRQSLEHFGYTVIMNYIGRPNDFIEVLEDRFPIPYDYLIISCHGNDGNFVMPILGEDIYTLGEPRHDLSHTDIAKYLRISGKTIISTGCTTGYTEVCKVFGKNNVYIAPTDYIEGTSAAYFVVSMFYALSRGKEFTDAFAFAKGLDEETDLYVIS